MASLTIRNLDENLKPNYGCALPAMAAPWRLKYGPFCFKPSI